ncbi:MAG: hypothetical protein ACK4P8_00170 [Tabrizicola sp.]
MMTRLHVTDQLCRTPPDRRRVCGSAPARASRALVRCALRKPVAGPSITLGAGLATGGGMAL